MAVFNKAGSDPQSIAVVGTGAVANPLEQLERDKQKKADLDLKQVIADREAVKEATENESKVNVIDREVLTRPGELGVDLGQGRKQEATDTDTGTGTGTGTGTDIQSTLTKQINNLVGGGDKFMDVAGATKLLEKQREGLTNRSAKVEENLNELNARLEKQGRTIGGEALMAAGFSLMQGGNIGSAGEKALKQFSAARRDLNKSKIAAKNAQNQFDLAMDARARGDLKEARNYALQHNKAILERDRAATESIYKITSLGLEDRKIGALIGREQNKQFNTANQRTLKGLELQMRNLNKQLDRTFNSEEKAFLQSQIDNAYQRYQMLSVMPALTIQTAEDS